MVDRGAVVSVEPIASAAADRWLVPGFIDLQVNGIDDIDVTTADGAAWDRLDMLLLAQGVTTWCPTLVSMPRDRYDAPLRRIAAAMDRPSTGRPAIAGAHLEGPFLGRSPGAHRPELIVPIDLEWLAALPRSVRVVTLAAEQPLAAAATRQLTAAGCLVSIGHTQASEAEFDAAVAAGARLTTHLFNGMSGLHHRSPGVAAFALTNSAVSASLIADGVHVHPRMLRLAGAALGADRMVLVTDAVAWRAGSVGGGPIELRDGAPRLPNGTLAGSSVTMIEAIRTCVAAGIDADHAFLAATTNPARLLGEPRRGALRPGHRGDMVAVSPNLDIEQVWVSGLPV
jgi:N-acetylglucosamine-6-phosphate deacetylase